jgi:hypothetical protein
VHLYTPSPTADATRRNPTLRRRNAKRKVRHFFPKNPSRRNIFPEFKKQKTFKNPPEILFELQFVLKSQPV